MPSGKAITEAQSRHVLQLLRQCRRPGSEIKRARIPEIAQVHRHTVTTVIEQAAIKWLEIVESAEREADFMDRHV